MSILKRLFGKKTNPNRESHQITLEKMMRDNEARQIEREAREGKTEVDRLVAELIEIGRSPGYHSLHHEGKFGDSDNHIRTREIGEELNRIGGMDLMQEAHYKIRATLDGGKARMLESVWGGIGDWLS